MINVNLFTKVVVLRGGEVSGGGLMDEDCKTAGESALADVVHGSNKGGLPFQHDNRKTIEHEVKFEIQMYKFREQEYVLDFQVRTVPEGIYFCAV